MFFFFQAEDGIRDIGVTGVQTCALPIWTTVAQVRLDRERGSVRYSRAGHLPPLVVDADGDAAFLEIGRASCRERGVDLGGRRIIKKKKLKMTRRPSRTPLYSTGLHTTAN